MKKLYLSIQGGWLTRVGHRRRFLAVYRQWNWGGENAERFHSHPWRFAVGVDLRGWIEEKFPGMLPVLRSPFSVSFNRGCLNPHEEAKTAHPETCRNAPPEAHLPAE